MRRFLGYLLIVVLSPLASTLHGAAPEEFIGRVVTVPAGHLIIVKHHGRREPVRFYGVAPAFGPRARESRDALKALTDARAVQIQPLRRDRQGRIVARVQFIGGLNLAETMVERGLATWDRKEAPKEWRLARCESRAKALKRGVWSTPPAVRGKHAKGAVPGSADPPRIAKRR